MPRDSKLWEQAYASHKVVQYRPTEKRPRSIRTESMVLEHELINLTAQIKLLTCRKKAVQRELKSRGQTQIRSEYFDKPIVLYALKLEHDCWYVGMSRNVERRLQRHLKGKGAQWTKQHCPVEIFEVRETKLTDDAEVAVLEDDMTLEYAMKYGTDKVRGGGYCQSKPRWPDVVIQNELVTL